MFESYMFIPANKNKFINKSLKLKNLDHRIFDLEDSVAEKNIKNAIDNLRTIEILQSDWIRMPIDRNGQVEMISEVHKLGFNNYMIPKFEGYEEFTRIFSEITSINKQAKFIL